jgi:hypothetical protein
VGAPGRLLHSPHNLHPPPSYHIPPRTDSSTCARCFGSGPVRPVRAWGLPARARPARPAEAHGDERRMVSEDSQGRAYLLYDGRTSTPRVLWALFECIPERVGELVPAAPGSRHETGQKSDWLQWQTGACSPGVW